jgi:hypothetical protein
MSEFPNAALIRRVQGLITHTFDVSDEEAQGHAAGLVALAQGWGNLESAKELNWEYRIKKDLGETEKLKWRSEEERKKFEAAERQSHADWDAFFNGRKRG